MILVLSGVSGEVDLLRRSFAILPWNRSRIEDPPTVDDSEADQRKEDVTEKHCERATESILSSKMPWDRFCQRKRTEDFLKNVLPIKKAPKGQQSDDNGVLTPSIDENLLGLLLSLTLKLRLTDDL
jgi:hypothetical protein